MPAVIDRPCSAQRHPPADSTMRDIKERLGLSRRVKNKATAINVPAQVSAVGHERVRV